MTQTAAAPEITWPPTPSELATAPGNLALDGPSEVEQSLRLLAGIVTLERLWTETERQSLGGYRESAIYDKAASYSCLL